MDRGRAICESVHLSVLGVWLGALVMTGVTAAIIFPAMKGLDPSLPAYAAYGGAHWSLAAGNIASRVFLACDVIQFVAVIAATLTFGCSVLWFGLSQRRISTFLRALLLVSLILSLSYQFFVLQTAMNNDLRAYWAAALAGDNATAESRKAAFDARHPRARTLMAIDAGLVLAAMVAAWVSALGRNQAPAEATHPGGLEPPRLLKGRG